MTSEHILSNNYEGTSILDDIKISIASRINKYDLLGELENYATQLKSIYTLTRQIHREQLDAFIDACYAELSVNKKKGITRILNDICSEINKYIIKKFTDSTEQRNYQIRLTHFIIAMIEIYRKIIYEFEATEIFNKIINEIVSIQDQYIIIQKLLKYSYELNNLKTIKINHKYCSDFIDKIYFRFSSNKDKSITHICTEIANQIKNYSQKV